MDNLYFSGTQVSIDKDSLKFLYGVYFGAYEDIYDAASNRAYRDMNRTIRFNGLPQQERAKLRMSVNELLKKHVKHLLEAEHISQQYFDEWHKNVCVRMSSVYQERGVTLTCGQSQKWLNMLLKYLYVLNDENIVKVFSFCHVPLDNYVFEVAEKTFKVQKSKIPWSRWNEYEAQYMDYQRRLRHEIIGEAPLRWEFKAWLKEARGI